MFLPFFFKKAISSNNEFNHLFLSIFFFGSIKIDEPILITIVFAFKICE